MRGDLPSREQLGLPEVLSEIALSYRGGLILITGGPKSGVTTTLNWMLDFLNTNLRAHLMIFEERIEISHYHKLSMVSQREKGKDYHELCSALRETPRQGASVVMIGAPLDTEALLIAAELGNNRHTIMAGMPGNSAVEVLESIRERVGPLRWRGFVDGLGAVVHQRLLAGRYGERVPVLEVLRKSAAVANLLHEQKLHLLPQSMETGYRLGMQSLEQALCKGVLDGLFPADEALRQARDPQLLRSYLARHGQR